jgi:hypothetical protein
MRSSDGVYPAQSAYKVQFEGNIVSVLPSHIWSTWAPSRCMFFIWLMLQNQIWTLDRLQQRGWLNEYFSVFCRQSLETPCHLFHECPVTSQVLTAIARWASWPRFLKTTWRIDATIQEWFMTMSGNLQSREAKGIKYLIIVVLRTIWCERNARIISRNERTIPSLIIALQYEPRQWYMVGAKNLASILACPCRE